MHHSLLPQLLCLCLILGTPLRAADILPPGAKPTLLSEQGAGEGPAWHPELGLLTSGGGHIYRRDRDGKQTIFRENAGTNGLLIDREGRLVMCEPVRRRVSRLLARRGPPGRP